MTLLYVSLAKSDCEVNERVREHFVTLIEIGKHLIKHF